MLFSTLYSQDTTAGNEENIPKSIGNKQSLNYPMGNIHFAGNLGFILLTDEEFTGVYNWFLNANLYGRVYHNLYIGGEISYAKFNFNFYTGGSIYYISSFILPFELNVKYSLAALPFLIFDFGGGLSLTYIRYITFTEGLFGGQIFINMNFKFGRFFFGPNTKLQLIQDVKYLSISPSNYRIGFHIGGLF